ncbi:MAG: diacylglycerol/lipid kinase family protein [Gammaproteobacteria bacterium]
MNSRSRPLVIVNNVAARAKRAWPEIEAALTNNGIEWDVHFTTSAGDATATTKQALRNGRDTIAVVGGDGTLSEVAAGFFDIADDPQQLPRAINKNATLAVLPAGTGDDFARGLTGKREPLRLWLNALVDFCAGETVAGTRRVDVIYGQATTDRALKGFICLNAATVGLGAEVASHVAAQSPLIQRLPGEIRFMLAACFALIEWKERHVRVTIDDEIVELKSNLLAVTNGVFAGGGMMFAPSARLDDASMDVLLSWALTRSAIVLELPRIRMGKHVENPNVRVSRATSVRIDTGDKHLLVEADGNVRGYTPVEFRIMPAALRIVAP